jgi:hypothetical protein
VTSFPEKCECVVVDPIKNPPLDASVEVVNTVPKAPKVFTDGHSPVSISQERIVGHGTAAGIISSTGVTHLSVGFILNSASLGSAVVVQAGTAITPSGSSDVVFSADVGSLVYSLVGSNVKSKPLPCGEEIQYQAFADYSTYGRVTGVWNSFKLSCCKSAWGVEPLKNNYWEWADSSGVIHTLDFSNPKPDASAHEVCHYHGFITDFACGLLTGIGSGMPAGLCQQPAGHVGTMVTTINEIYRVGRKTAQDLDQQKFVGSGDDFGCSLENGSGKIYCWGRNLEGQVGTGAAGNFTVHASPVIDSSGPASLLTGASELSVGINSACAIKGSDVYCWGSNGSGQLGRLDIAYSATPIRVDLSGVPLRASEVPTRISVSGYYPTEAGRTESHCSDPSETRLLAGITFTMTENHCSRSTACITTDQNRLICWGNNGEGQMGIGAPSGHFEKRLPTQSFRSAGTSGTYYENLVKPEVGTTAICALDTAGTIRCAGSTGSSSARPHIDGKSGKCIFGTGVLGDCDAIEKFNPVAVRKSGAAQPVFTDFSFNGFTGLAISTPAPSPSPSKQVYGWGYIPHPTPSPSPSPGTHSLSNATSELLTASSSNSDFVSTHWFGASWGASGTSSYFFGINYGAYGAANPSSGVFDPLITSALGTGCSSSTPLKGIVLRGQNSKFITSTSKPKMISKGSENVFNLYSIQDDGTQVGLVKSIGQGWYGALGNDSVPGSSVTCSATRYQVKK